MADPILKRNTPIQEKGALLRKRAEGFTRQEMDLIDRRVPPPDITVEKGRLHVGAVFISNSPGPQISGFDLHILDWKKRLFKVDELTPSASLLRDGHGIPITFGRQDGADAYWAKHPRSPGDVTDAEGLNIIKTILDLQVKATPHDVGRPFVVGLISPNEFRWLETGNGTCRNPAILKQKGRANDHWFKHRFSSSFPTRS